RGRGTPRRAWRAGPRRPRLRRRRPPRSRWRARSHRALGSGGRARSGAIRCGRPRPTASRDRSSRTVTGQLNGKLCIVEGMPDRLGKRQRESGKAKKAAAREERRLARAQRDADREAGLIEAGTPIEASEPAAPGLETEAERGTKAAT